MKIQKSAEDYLETILILHTRKGSVRSIDIASELDFSKPSVSVAMKHLRENGYIEVDERKDIRLTDRGREVAERMYERHLLLTELLKALGVEESIAVHEACKIEHDISAETFALIKSYYEAHMK